MSIRTVLGAISSLCTDYYSNIVLGGEALGRQQLLVTTPRGMRPTIKFHEITGTERMAVTDLLISQTLDKVKYTLVHFQGRLESVRAKKPAVGLVSPSERPYLGQTKIEHDVETLSIRETGDLNQLLLIRQDLETTVQILENITRKGRSVYMSIVAVYAAEDHVLTILSVSDSVSTSSASSV